ncbi:sodium-dependent bicarbonate transport family permease [Ectobacillus antri]|uniref:Sodium-dependent bicarbonate transport family permease n=1 Tax=Ectobacillus antri TaxID=2486280 RepID=A0ABT6H6J7_9BACI|nr:sodium-dependent bicarbonate transport family permease [Ectobacillus antri]MDG4657250.1 sodium-dependent bicarbonate transport family permease [Ectobacillus antri]MDG5754398.1 sodium-dependent bicarbonate transport family permease [Ectobacillus antri]
MMELVLQNVLTPAVLFFILGIFAAVVKSDLKFPQGLSEFLSIYLLVAIGLKGGVELSKHALSEVSGPMLGVLCLGTLIPVVVMLICERIGLDRKNAAALAACYGSVSIVTYGAGVTFLEQTGTSFESYMSAMVVLMESPAIFVALYFLKLRENTAPSVQLGIVAKPGDASLLRESLFGKSILLLVGSLLIGWILGPKAVPVIKPLFIDLYGSMLVLFLLNMGVVAGQRLPTIFSYGIKLIGLGILFPLIFGTTGVLVGYISGLSAGGMMLMGVLAGSASYIAAPAALRASVPEANASIYLGLALGVTFPFNLIFGIPLYYQIALLLA